MLSKFAINGKHEMEREKNKLEFSHSKNMAN